MVKQLFALLAPLVLPHLLHVTAATHATRQTTSRSAGAQRPQIDSRATSSNNASICNVSIPNDSTIISGNASVPLKGYGADPGEFIEWTVMVSESASSSSSSSPSSSSSNSAGMPNPTIQTFFFLYPRDIIDPSVTSVNLSCYFDASSGADALDKARNGSTSCAKLVGDDCINTLAQKSHSLENATISELGSSTILACQVDSTTGQLLSMAECAPPPEARGGDGVGSGGINYTGGGGDADDDGSNNWKVTVLAPVLGGVGLAAIILAVVLFFKRRRRARMMREKELELQDSDGSGGSGGNYGIMDANEDESPGVSFKPVVYAESGSGQSAYSREYRHRGAGSEIYEYEQEPESRPMSNPSDVASQHSRAQLIRVEGRGRGESRRDSRRDRRTEGRLDGRPETDVPS